MARLGIFTGTTLNDGTGDTLSQGAVKINSNFAEIYSAFGDGTNLTKTISFATTSINVVGGIASVTSLNVSSGIATVGFLTANNINVKGITTSTSFSGSGANLTGIVTSIVAGTNITISSSTGQVIINSSGGGGNSSLSISTNTTNQNQYISYATSFGSTTGLGATSLLVYNPSTGNLGIGTTNPQGALQIGIGATFSSTGNATFVGIVTANSFRGDGSQLTGISSSGGGGVSISTNTTNQNQYIPYATSFGSTTGLGATSLLVYNPSTGNLGIGTTNPQTRLQVIGDANVSGIITASKFVGDLTGTATTATTALGLSTSFDFVTTGIITAARFVSNQSIIIDGSTLIGSTTLSLSGVSSDFTTVGSNTFTVPAGVTKISAIVIAGGGGGGMGQQGSGGSGGGGGGLRYINDYPVTPGQVLNITVGNGGNGGNGTNGIAGGTSEITGVVSAYGGAGGSAFQGGSALGGTGSTIGGNIGGGNGGRGGGGTLTTGGGGGGAGGYTGNGGNGTSSSGNNGSGGSGAGGGGFGSGGGGVGLLGESLSGFGFVNAGGQGGSGGSSGTTGTNNSDGSPGGNYGAGGGGGENGGSTITRGGNGAQGAVRILWSPKSKFSRLYPSHQVGNNINQ